MNWFEISMGSLNSSIERIDLMFEYALKQSKEKLDTLKETDDALQEIRNAISNLNEATCSLLDYRKEQVARIAAARDQAT